MELRRPDPVWGPTISVGPEGEPAKSRRDFRAAGVESLDLRSLRSTALESGLSGLLVRPSWSG